MFYQNAFLSTERKETQLDVLLAESNPLADAISLASARSLPELTVIAEKGISALSDVAAPDGPVILRSIHQTVPVLGGRELQEFLSAYEDAGSYIVAQQESALEMNLALFYTVLAHGNGPRCQSQPRFEERARNLVENRGSLVGRAWGKLHPQNLFGRMQLAKRLGAIRYLDACSIILKIHSAENPEGSESPGDLEWHLEKGTEVLTGAYKIAKRYDSYSQFMAAFNLGRIGSLKGMNNASRHRFEEALAYAYDIRNPSFVQLAGRYLDADEAFRGFGAIISDPPEYTRQLLELVSEALTPSRIGQIRA